MTSHYTIHTICQTMFDHVTKFVFFSSLAQSVFMAYVGCCVSCRFSTHHKCYTVLPNPVRSPVMPCASCTKVLRRRITTARSALLTSTRLFLLEKGMLSFYAFVIDCLFVPPSEDMCFKVKIRCFGCSSCCNFVRIYAHVLLMECTLYALANHRAKSAVVKCVQL